MHPVCVFIYITNVNPCIFTEIRARIATRKKNRGMERLDTGFALTLPENL